MTERTHLLNRPWTDSEDRLLANAVAVHGEYDVWKAVAHCVPSRTIKACRKRWFHSLSPDVNKSPWTPEEDHKLLDLYKVHSAKWSAIAPHIPGRTDDACSKRFREALDPSLKRDEWSKEEDVILLEAYSRWVGSWSQVGQELQRSASACRNRWRLLQKKRISLPLTDPSIVSSEQSSPLLTYLHTPPPWQTPFMLDSSQHWNRSLPHFELDPSSASEHHNTHVTSHSDIGLLAGVDQSSVSHPQSIHHVVILPPPFQSSSSSLRSALSSSHALATTYRNGTGVTPPSINSLPPATITSVVFDYDVLDPSLVNTSQSARPTDHAQDGRHHMHDDYAPQPQYDDMHQSIASTSVYSSGAARRASDCSPAPHPNECNVRPVHHQMIGDAETSPSQLPRDSCYPHPTTSQNPSISLVTSGLHPIHEMTDNRYAAHPRQRPEQNVQHFVISSPALSSVSNPHHEYYPSPSSDLCSPMALCDAVSQHCNRNYPPSEHVGQAHQDIRLSSPRATTASGVCGDYYQPQPSHKDQSQQFHPIPNEPGLITHPARMSVADTSSPPTAPDNFFPVSSAQPSASNTPPTYTHPCMSSKATTSGAKRGPPLDNSSPNPDDPNPRPAARPRPSVLRKRPDIHAPLRLSSDLPATNDPSIQPYACGHENCWPASAASSLVCYNTSRSLSDHNKSAHPEDAGGDRPYRCGLKGCGKSWKSINGLQYHLQISKAHFQHAIVSTFVTCYIDGLTAPSVEASSAAGEGDDKTKRQYSCPHQGCPNRYKQLSGLRYHLAHGHPTDLPVQLDLVPPALSRKLAEKMRKEGSSSQPPDAQMHIPPPAPDPSLTDLSYVPT